jgi:rhodanese-related sulfurtransferase
VVVRRVQPATLKSWLRDGAELAILDAREEGEFSAGHLLWASPCPLSAAELRLPSLLPCRYSRVVCTDAGEGLADRLASALVAMGYRSVWVLAGGTPAWADAGFEVFSGFNVPSKAFGEWVEHRYATPSVDAAELNAMRAAGGDFLVVDSRPLEEFRNMSIPGAVNVPGAELALRVPSMVRGAETTIVVNCAGRTRSILGAESLRRIGLANSVVALRNGTMGWQLAGFACDRGRAERYPEGVPVDANDTLEKAKRFSRAHGVRGVGPDGLAALRADTTATTYVFDVRDPAEYAAGHLPGSISAPGGQLVQATDIWAAVANARIVLVDDVGVRAHMTGGWLRQLRGWEVLVLEDGLRPPLSMPRPRVFPANVARVDASELHDLLERGEAVVVDLDRSLAFRKRHIPGAHWGVRTRLKSLAAGLPEGRRIVVAATDPELAALGVMELESLLGRPVSALEGGTAAWVAAGFALEHTPETPADGACVDVWLRPYDRTSGVEAAMRAYLDWEVGLVAQIERDGDAPFGAW